MLLLASLLNLTSQGIARSSTVVELPSRPAPCYIMGQNDIRNDEEPNIDAADS